MSRVCECVLCVGVPVCVVCVCEREREKQNTANGVAFPKRVKGNANLRRKEEVVN